MTLYLVGRFVNGFLVLTPCPTYIDALLHQAALRRQGVSADIVVREVDRVSQSEEATLGH